ncbi:RagB/SusD family nutrient uptake outer membrane protein [Sphingobacterium haloxyli]|uniref:RagB/SusD family nutrient uptake outer membrane protein n=1 Tax=Sphingobacterium haloxyli TaxID=2100533 RepID=A0A2S9J4Q1_9SPHI|nr:RagB/SusD family nutrient uptake outer membrane protein [Sphingobacterium haloxyli]PRD47745.1 RagB/SusD family nutrient uptake outer membrane protein [Sphingobacterium haloxyli]
MKILIRNIALIILLSSCNEEKWLQEEPLDFYSPENSYRTIGQFQHSVNYLYDNLRNLYWSRAQNIPDAFFTPSDFCFFSYDFPNAQLNNLSTFLMATTVTPQKLWTVCYNQINSANTILNRLQLADQISEAEKGTIRGQALFFRAFAYRVLANYYGGVPISLEEITVAKRDYVRATRAEVYDQCRSDLEEAEQLLANIDQVADGKVSKQAVQHLLTEIYISLERYTDAINTASAIISLPQMGLMTQRFGSRKGEQGNVYWDLFQANNQNRTSGNSESIFVLQYDFQNPGSNYSAEYPRYFLPAYFSVQVEANSGNMTLAFPDITAEKGGRGIGSNHGTHYFFNELWGTDLNRDLRATEPMIVRDFRIDNRDAKGFGQWLVKDGWLRTADTLLNFFPFIMKGSRVGDFPQQSYARNSDGSIKTTPLGEHVILNSSGLANGSFKDEYAFRLAETYLLRAEAYLGNNEKQKALADINIIRQRANATLAVESDITVDYILEERLRELYMEEWRTMTLCRLGKNVERTRKYNPAGFNVGDHQNLWPIPYGEIEKNIFAELTQNDGY